MNRQILSESDEVWLMDFKSGSYIIRLTRGRKYLGRQNAELVPIKGTGDTKGT